MSLRRQAQPAAPVSHHTSVEAKRPERGERLVVRRDDQVLFDRVRHARDFFARLRGLLMTGPMQPHEGLLLTPCRQVHTIGMGYPIDIIFLDLSGQILRCLSDVRPYRAVSAPGAAHTLEVAAGRIKQLGIAPGQNLIWSPADTQGVDR